MRSSLHKPTSAKPVINRTEQDVRYGRIPQSAEQVIHVGTGSAASDSNDGLTPYSAKATLGGAVTALGGVKGLIKLGYGTFTETLSGSAGYSVPSGTVVEGIGPTLTTIATEATVTATGVIFTLANNANFGLRRLSVTGPTNGGIGTYSPQFITTAGSWTTGRIRIDDVNVTGDWDLWLHVGSPALTPDVMVDRCVFNMRGTPIIVASSANSNAGGRLIVDRTRFEQYGVAASNLWHAIYCYTNTDLIVTRSEFLTNVGIGAAVQHYGSAVKPNRSELDGCYFSSDSYYGFVAELSDTAIPTSIKSCTFACSTYFAVANSHLTFEDCSFLGNALVTQVSAEANANVRIRLRRCHHTGTTSLVQVTTNGTVADVAECFFPSYSTTQAVATLVSSPTGTTILDRLNDKAGTLSNYIPPTTKGHGFGFDGGTHDVAVGTNQAVYTRFEVLQTVTANRLVVNIGTSSGNIDVGIYADNSGAPGAKILTTGSMASPGGNRQAITITATTLTPGVYWCGIATDNSTITIRGNSARAQAVRNPYTQAVFPLPSTATPVSGGTSALTFSVEAG